jgi:2-polyprenyl-3-methyl-5-hydroxy-6-metoxy-1,4-benzoquinol methylase
MGCLLTAMEGPLSWARNFIGSRCALGAPDSSVAQYEQWYLLCICMCEQLVEGAKFHQDLSASWSESYETGGFGMRIKLMRAILLEVVQPNSVWLDGGCGSGILSRELSTLGAKVVGLDASPNMIRVAKSESISESQSISYKLVKSIESIDISNSTFDGILCSSVVEYVESPKAVFIEFSRVLKPEGRIVVSLPNKFSLIRMFQKFCRRMASLFGLDVFTYLEYSKKEFSLNSAEKLLRQTGFCVESVQLFDPLLPSIIANLGIGSLIIISARLEGP